MTDREKAIVMARTGICMLKEEKFGIFYQYLEELFGRPVFTHELPMLEKEIKARSNDDFIELCRSEDRSEEPKWIVGSGTLRDEMEVLISHRGAVWEDFATFDDDGNHILMGSGIDADSIDAWMPLPQPYKGGQDERQENDIP